MTSVLGMFRPHERSKMIVRGESRTHQSFKKECDINEIMRKYERQGILSHVNKYGGQYGDFVSAPDYHTAMNVMMEAEEMFGALPAKVRAKFANDPAAFLEFAQNPDNLEEMRELGLARRSESELPDPVKPGPPPAADEPQEGAP